MDGGDGDCNTVHGDDSEGINGVVLMEGEGNGLHLQF